MYFRELHDKYAEAECFEIEELSQAIYNAEIGQVNSFKCVSGYKKLYITI